MGSNDCVKCMSRIPYATLIATIMCCVGVGVFCGTMYKGAALTLHMAETFFFRKYYWLGDLQLVFVIVGSIMGAIGLFLLLVGCLATGSTRAKVYKGWKSRVGGRVSCVLLMVLAYVLNLAWMMILGCLVIITIIFTIFWASCNKRVKTCIHLELFDFLYPNTTKIEDMKLCEVGEIKQFCRDYVEPAEVMYILATVSCLLVVLSLVHYLMCLAANYTHIKEHEKYLDLQELQYLQDSELSSMPKQRF
ncbi:hypothetical protein CHUAL_000683 [Chamberlinius hualienensis]